MRPHPPPPYQHFELHVCIVLAHILNSQKFPSDFGSVVSARLQLVYTVG